MGSILKAILIPVGSADNILTGVIYSLNGVIGGVALLASGSLGGGLPD